MRPRSVTSHILANAAVVADGDGKRSLALRLMLRITSYEADDLLRTLLSRPRLATLPPGLAESMADLCSRLVSYFLQRTPGRPGRSSAILPFERVRVAMECLSRFALRLGPARAADLFADALRYYAAPAIARNFHTHDAIGNLLQRTWEALPPRRRTDLVFDVLNAPIVGVDGFDAEPLRFMDPGQLIDRYGPALPERTERTEARWQETVRFLVRSLTLGREARSRAMLRLLHVVMAGRLDEAEERLVAEAIWDPDARAVHGLPAQDTLRHWVYLRMPEPEPGIAMAWFRETSMPDDPSAIADEPALESALFHLGDAIAQSEEYGLGLELTGADRSYVVELVRRWSDAPLPDDLLLPIPMFDQRRTSSMRNAVRGLTTLLVELDMPRDVAEALLRKHGQLYDAGFFALPLLVGLGKALPDEGDEIAATFRKGLSSADESAVYSVTQALQAWLHFAQRRAVERPPADLVRELGFAVATRRRPAVGAALALAKWIFQHGDRADRDRLRHLVVEGLGYLVHELDYANSDHDDIDAFPDMRWNCVGIARAMHDAGERDPVVLSWLRLAREDPLREVRQAASDVVI